MEVQPRRYGADVHGRWGRLALGVLAAAAVSSCGEGGTDAVRVRYSLTNTGAGPITVLNRVPDGAAGAAVDYDGGAAWVTAGADGEVVVSQQVFPRPDDTGTNWETSPVTGATTLAAGTTLRGTVSVPRPFVGAHPYGEEQTDLSPAPTAVRFCLGAITEPLAPGDTRKARREEGLLVVNDDSTYRRQHLFCSEPEPLD